MKIELREIKKIVNLEIYRRGLRYFKQGRVTLNKIDLTQFEATVQGSFAYQVSVQLTHEHFLTSCTCPYWATCKHVIAALLAAKEWYDENRETLVYQETNPDWNIFFDDILKNHQVSETNGAKLIQKWKIIYLVKLNSESWSIMPQKAYIKKDNSLGRLTNIGEFDPQNSSLVYSQNDPIVIAYLQNLEQHYNSFYDYNYYRSNNYFDSHVFHFKYGSKLGPLLDFLSDSDLYINSDLNQNIEFEPESCSIDLWFDETEDDFELVCEFVFKDIREKISPDFHILSENPVWILWKNRLYRVNNLDSADILVPFTRSSISLQIPKSEFSNFVQDKYFQLANFTSLSLPDSVVVDVVNEIKQVQLYLREGYKELFIDLVFDYDNFKVEYKNPYNQILRKNGNGIVQIVRNREKEESIRNELLETGLRNYANNELRIIDSKALEWMFDNIPKLSGKGFVVFGEGDLKKYKVRTGSPNVKVAVSSQIDWFDLNLEIDIDGVSLSMKELRKSMFHHKRYVKLVDGSTARLTEEWYKKFQHLFNFTDVQDEQIKIPQYHATLIDLLLEEASSKTTDREFENRLQRLRDFSQIRQKKLPSKINGLLRPYQKAGYDWLYFLQDHSFGGCLADDMGLGKTLQTLTMLLMEKEKGNKIPSIIVCPTSVVFNWEREIQKFTPDLKVHIHTGLDRVVDAKMFYNYDIVLTTYGIMRRDIVLLKDVDFFYAILDESQKIKNPISQTAKASRLLNAKYRLVLTGTPVENNTLELWSQFSFLNPGLLGSINYFKRSFSTPIEKKGETETAEFLRQIIFPFILRRTKENVAKELPPKFEQTVYCSMNEKQEQLYKQWRDHYRAILLNRIDTVGIEKSHMNILEGLVKLRQISCHPFLVDKSTLDDSGKFEALKEFVDEILSEKHKVLIFSQFVKMLKLMQQYLDKNNIPYEYLDGHTKNRHECVDRFQNDDDKRIFLISLKAGGTGLNLTAADYVIHYDPWWNPAVEMQATDRAHRIGQQKNVFVYRLITKNSVEEKMLELQAKKKNLVSNLISTDTNFFKNLTRKDIEILFS